MTKHRTITSRSNCRTALVLLCAICSLLLAPADGNCGQWRVVPARVFFDRGTKSAVISVVNEGEEKINLQVQAMEWTQDSQGKDVYKETSDIIFFPRILMVDKGEQRIVRAGIKLPATDKEKTYRLFIEEIPQPKKNDPDHTQLTLAIRFGVPIFVSPAQENVKAEISNAALAKGILTTAITNTGNTHFRIGEISVQGKNGKGEESFAAKQDGWYLLNGMTRSYSTTIPKDKCNETAQLAVTVATDKKITLNRNLNVEKALCLP